MYLHPLHRLPGDFVECPVNGAAHAPADGPADASAGGSAATSATTSVVAPDALDHLQRLLDTHRLGAWVCATAEGLVANHLPFVLARAGTGTAADGSAGAACLQAHVARANPVWHALAAGQPSVVIFQGPQAYVSPSWYPGKAAHGRVVPTWDYLVAHVHGVARAVHEPAWLADLLDRLTHAQERLQPQPWRPQDAPADYLEAMTQAIVGIEVRIERVELKLKASQDEDLADRHGTVHGLQAQGGEAAAMAALVARALAAEGHGPA